MKFHPLTLLILPAIFIFSGCCFATVNILPKEASAQAISESSSESCAIQKAQEEAAEYCKKSGKQYVAVNTESKYQGADPNAKLALSFLSAGKSNGNNSNDYRVLLDFRCE